MPAHKLLRITRVLVLLAAIGWTMAPAVAEQKAAPQSPFVAPPPQTTGWIKDPSKLMPMRQMANAQRRAAALRNAQRRHAAHPGPKGSTTQGAGS